MLLTLFVFVYKLKIISHYHHHNYYITSCEFFTPAWSGSGLFLELEWQQVSSGLQDSSQYSGRFQQCHLLDVLDFPLISNYSNVLFKPLEIVPWASTTTGITITFDIPQVFLFSGKVQVIVYLFAFFYFHSVVLWNGKIHKRSNSLFVFFNYH